MNDVIKAYVDNIDIKYSYKLAKSLEKFRTNKKLGYRTAGSKAEIKTGIMLKNEMEKIGLKNVRRDKINLDSWEFEKAIMKFEDEDGHTVTCYLGAYQTNFITHGFKKFEVVFAGRGTLDDYKDIDVSGKLVIIDINQRDEWWINYPVYEAYIRGAACLIAVQQYGYGQISDESLNAQDISGPSEAAALSMSKKDAAILKQLIKSKPDLKIELSVKSQVKKDTYSYNILGEIIGENTNSYVLLTAHYDSYFSGFQDDNAAVGMLLGIAKSMIISEYKPQKTIIFMALCAEEWGVVDSKYDWSTGAYEEVFKVHPEWSGKVVANINFELPAHSHGQKDAIRSIYEYVDFLKGFVSEIIVPEDIYPKGLRIKSPIQTWSDDFSIAIAGIPSMVNDFSSGTFMETHYHSQFDNEEFYDEKVYMFHHELYGRLLITWDRVLISPMDFTKLLTKVSNSVNIRLNNAAGADTDALNYMLDRTMISAKRLYTLISEVNAEYSMAVENEDTNKIIDMVKEYGDVGKLVLEAFKKTQDVFVRLNWNDEVVFPHVGVSDNIIAIEATLYALKRADVYKALENIYNIDNNRYAFRFSEKVYIHFTDYVFKQPKDRLKWGDERIIHHINLYESVNRLKRKAEEYDTGTFSRRAIKSDLKKEIRYYEKIKTEELQYLKEDIEYMGRALEKIDILFGKAILKLY